MGGERKKEIIKGERERIMVYRSAYFFTRSECDWQCVACSSTEHKWLWINDAGELTSRDTMCMYERGDQDLHSIHILLITCNLPAS